jgi:hypothetical protein
MSDDAVMQAVSAIRAAARSGQTVELDIAVDRLIMLVAKLQAKADQLDNQRALSRDRTLRHRASRYTPSPSPPMINNSTPPSPTQNKSIKPRLDEPLFDEFWGVYPLKVGKGAARKAYRHALTRASSAEILAGAKRYAASKPEPKFTAHPTTWLNADRWLDEAAKPSSNVSLGPWKPFTPEKDPPKPPPEERERQVISRLKQLRPANI